MGNGEGEVQLSLEERYARLFQNPELMSIITSFVANGGTLLTLCETWNVHFGRVSTWIHEDSTRHKQYLSALRDREEWGEESILRELRSLAHSDIRQIFNECGGVKPVNEWPAIISSAVAAIDVIEIWANVGEGRNKEKMQVGEVKKIKFWDKTKSLELLGKNLKMFSDKLEVSGKLSLADLLEEKE